MFNRREYQKAYMKKARAEAKGAKAYLYCVADGPEGPTKIGVTKNKCIRLTYLREGINRIFCFVEIADAEAKEKQICAVFSSHFTKDGRFDLSPFVIMEKIISYLDGVSLTNTAHPKNSKKTNHLDLSKASLVHGTYDDETKKFSFPKSKVPTPKPHKTFFKKGTKL